MNKNAIQKYAIWARNELIEQVKQRAYQYGISAKGYGDENAAVVAGRVLSSEEKRQRAAFVSEIKRNGFEQAVEDVAYTWFNRFVALRFMEVNDYLPTHVRVFSDASGGFNPEILKDVLHLELEGLDKSKVSELLNANQTEELYRYLLLTQCNALNDALPEMFEKLGSYTEMLLPNNILKQDSLLARLVKDIDEDDWKDAVQIIGWMYQHYNTEPKQAVFDGLKKNVKITKEKIPAATQLFTPDWIVRYMVENSLGRLWLESHPNPTLKANWKYYLDEAEQTPEVAEKLRVLRTQSPVKSPEDIRLIDPCMGSGHILVYAFDVLMQIYESEGYNPRDVAKLIIEKNVYGLDIDCRAYQLAYFSLMMKARQYNRRIFTDGVKPQVYHPAGFPDGEEYGSLVKVDELPSKPELPKDQLSVFDDYERDLRVWNFKRLLAQKYDVIVTNPPYMGSDNMSAKLKTFVTNHYYDERYDIYAAFVSRCLRMKNEDGYVSIITQNSFLYALCFSSFRNTLINNTRIVNAIHLGPRAFEDISGEVVQTIATVFSRRIKDYRSSIKRLVDFTDKKEQAFFSEIPYLFDTEFFKKLPNNVFAYSISTEMKKLCIDEQKIGDFFISKAGVVTGNDDYFLRYWHEIRFVELDLNAIDTTSKYVPFSKGGSFVKWYGNIVYAIKLAELWTDSKVNKSVRRGDTTAYFKRAIGWSYMGGGNKKNFSLLNGCVCGTGTPTILNENDDQFFYALGFLNTKIPQRFIELFNPTLNTYASDICNLPLVHSLENSDIVNKVKLCIGIAQNDWNSFETSWDFKVHPLVELRETSGYGADVSKRNCTIESAFENWDKSCNNRFAQIKANEEELNRIFIDIYGLQDELTPEVEDKDVTVRRADLGREIRSLISYAVGCMFGRYSLDTEGLAYAGGNWDENKYRSFIPDKDNILPICDDEYFDDDILGRFVDFVRVVYGAETLEENLKYIADALGGNGTPREVIRNYFLNDFYKDHCRIYQKRPIYWLFDSGKKNGFKSLVYLHRYQSDLLAKLRTDYVHEQQERYRTQLSHINAALNTATGSERARLLKQQDKLSEQLKEITAFEEKVHHLADQNITIDLDDGVKKNYEIFTDVLAKI